jgi:tetratricopeptide (TPR) repeat protein
MNAPMSCLDAVAVQAFVEGSISPEDRAGVEAHLDGCASCRRLIAALAMTNPPTVSATKPASEPASVVIGPTRLLAVGTTVGRYEVIGYLGRGGMGIVYHAHDPELRRDVALKLLRADRRDDDDDASARLVREAQSMAQIAHPNVIAVFDVGTWEGEVFVAMELVSGGTLRAWCEQPHEQSEVIEAFVAAGRGLSAAHAAGLIHRDFKPDNVLVGSDGRMRVTDFGLARSHDPIVERRAPRGDVVISDLTATGAVMGTPGYIAPELYAGEATDARTDQFAFCVALWEALHGLKPFPSVTEKDLISAIETGEIVAPPRRASASIQRALRRGLAAKPSSRWPTMDALLDELAPRPRRRRWPIAAAIAGTLAVAGGVAYAVYPSSSPPEPAPVVAVPAVPADAAVDPKLFAALQLTIPKIKSGMEHWQRGEHKEAHADLASAVETARHAGATSVLLDALCDQGYMLHVDGDLVGAEAALTEALDLAERTGNDPIRRRAITELVSVLDHAGKPDERLRKLAAAVTNRGSTGEDSRAAALELEAQDARDLTVARNKWDEALAIRDKLGMLVPRTMNRLGLAHALYMVPKLDAAHAVITDALEFIDKHGSAGGDAKEIATATSALLSVSAQVELARADYPAAEAVTRRNIALVNSLDGGESPIVSNDYMVLGSALLHQHRRTEGDAAYDKALALAAVNPQLEAQIYLMKAIAYHDDPALAHDAVIAADKGLAIMIKARGADHPDTVMMQVALCKLLVADHQLARVRPLAESLVAKVENDPLQLADVRFAIAQSLPASERARAHKLAEKARDAYTDGGVKAQDRLAKVQAWLAHPN